MEGYQESKSKINKASLEDEGYQKYAEDSNEHAANELFGEEVLSARNMLSNPHMETIWRNEPSSRERQQARYERLCKQLQESLKEHLLGENFWLRGAASDYINRGLVYSSTASSLAQSFLKERNISGTEDEGEESEVESEPAPTATTKDILALMFSALKEPETPGLEEAIEKNIQLPTELLAALVEGNHQALAETNKELNEKLLPEVKQQLQKELPAFLSVRGIPEERIHQLLNRLDEVAVHVVDGLSANLESIGGSYSDFTDQILVSASLLYGEITPELTEVLVHEYLHALSGRLIYKTTDSFEQDYSNESYDAGRIGLRFVPPLTSRGEERFRWLNEALTERLTLEFLKKTPKQAAFPSYRYEMEILAFLLEKGKQSISSNQFIAAYFENYEPSRQGEQTIPAWRELQKAITSNFGPGFLVALDKRIEEVGSKKALQELKRGQI